MSYYVISYITNGIKCLMKKLILLILRVIFFGVAEIVKLILIMAAVYAIAQLLYIAWERYIEKHVLSEFKALNDVSKLRSIQSVQFRSAISRSECSLHTINGPILSKTDTHDPGVLLKVERDTQTPKELLPVKIIYTTDAAERLHVFATKTGAENIKANNFVVAEGNKSENQMPENVSRIDKQPLESSKTSKRVIDNDISTQTDETTCTDSNTKNINSRKEIRLSSSEKETADEDIRITHRRRRKKKHFSAKYDPVKTLYENASSEDQTKKRFSKRKQSLKHKSKQHDSLDELELLNTPIPVENFLKKRDSAPIFIKEVPKETKQLRKKSTTKSNEELIQKDERQINKAVYAKRSILQ